ncbi:hypothetical protein F7725_009149 [Dissostichus mawsoni]|uniref:BHLH domain-containing protein n=1 Tax=Dissostichus mawsoni TaxID=36200 RepID=A0A7J5Z6R6_DISMA|nr:hypothetical protein F7725_009149 [Dissostichus mawsoni]
MFLKTRDKATFHLPYFVELTMLANTSLYAAKKRKKPVQKIPKPPPPDGIKSNPSKRHRDRLNGELDKLTSLLPFTEDVRARLDKLSVLRLSVGYLKVKSFFNATMKKGQNGSSWSSERSLMYGGNVQNALTPSTPSLPSSQRTSIDGSDVIHQSVFELIHTDDRALFRRQLHFALKPNSSQQDELSPGEQSSAEITSNVVTYDPQNIPPENSSFLERSFCCRFRCLLDNSSGFLALNFRGRLKFVHGQNRVSEDGTLVPSQLALFSIATPMQPPTILEIRTKTLIFQSKHKLDFTPMGIDPRGEVVLGYNEVEIRMKGSGYNFIHCRHDVLCQQPREKLMYEQMYSLFFLSFPVMKTGETGFIIFRLLSKSRTWVWVQANARLVFKAGTPDFIVARQRALTNEEGEEQLLLRQLPLPFNFATGEAVLYNVTPSVEVPDPGSAPKQRKLDTVNRESLLGCMLTQDQSLYCEHSENLSSINDTAFKNTHATVSIPGDIWQLTTAKPVVGSLVKTDATVQDMMETLQQILGDSELSEALEVEPDELKSWESTLLKMSSCEMSEDLDEILNNDILSYVEEQLQRDGGLNLPDDGPACISALDLQSQNPEQDFGWDLENQLIPNGQPAPGLGMMKLSHMDVPQMRLNGPSLQETLPMSADLHLGITGAPVSFPPAATTQRSLPIAAKENNFGAFTQSNHLNQMAPQLQMRTPSLPMGLQDQSANRQLNPVFSFQANQWSSSSVPNQATFAETYTQNISNESGFTADATSCLQGHFALQNSEKQRWLPEPQLISSGHQQMGAFLNQMSGFQRTPLPGVVTMQNAVNGRPMFMTPETQSVPFPVQQQLHVQERPPSSVPVNGVHLTQRLNPASNPIPSQPSCFYQAGVMPGRTAIPNPDEAALSCQTTTALDPNGLLQPYLNYNEQTQINSRPVVGNGGFPYSSLPNGNAYYSENK